MLRELRAADETRNIPAVALSAGALPRDAHEALDAGCQRYLTKPINVIKFVEALDDLLPAQQTRPES